MERKQGDFIERRDICLRCPRGCDVTTLVAAGGEIVSIEGNRCALGREYVEQEIRDPRRVLPTTIRVRGGERPLVPVWTPEPMPKDLLLELARETRHMEVEAPVHVGDVIVDNWRDTGVRLVASGEVARTGE